MELYKICHVFCHLMFLPSWITSKTLPELPSTHTKFNNTTGDLQDFAIVNTTDVFTTPNGNYSSQDNNKNNMSNDYQTQPTTTASIYMYATSPETQRTSRKDGILLTQTTQTSSQEGNVTVLLKKEKTIPTTAHIFRSWKRNEIMESNKTVTQENNVSEKVSAELSNNSSVTDNFTLPSEDRPTETTTTIPQEMTTTNNTFHDEKIATNYTTSENENNTRYAETTTDSVGTVTPTSAATTTAAIPKHTSTPHPHHKYIQNVWLGEKTRGRAHISSMHHLSLVPIEDGPFGSLIWRDKKYLITVLVPIGIGIVGAACIIGMAYVVRFCHRNERKMQEIRENIQKRFTAQNDQVILLTNSSDEEF